VIAQERAAGKGSVFRPGSNPSKELQCPRLTACLARHDELRPKFNIRLRRKPAKVTDVEREALCRALENPVCECARMADIAMDAQCADKAYAVFAVNKLCEMVLALREIYYGRDAGPIMERS
jgi:hypothetical protein